jgi:hypothetical protein
MSVDEFLQAACDTKWTPFESGSTDCITAADIASFLAGQPQIEAVSSHTLRPPGPLGFEVFPIALVRHPLDRAYSVYSHSRRAAFTYESAAAACGHDFAGFVRWCLDHPDRSGVVIVNYQVIHFSPASLSAYISSGGSGIRPGSCC